MLVSVPCITAQTYDLDMTPPILLATQQNQTLKKSVEKQNPTTSHSFKCIWHSILWNPLVSDLRLNKSNKARHYLNFRLALKTRKTIISHTGIWLFSCFLHFSSADNCGLWIEVFTCKESIARIHRHLITAILPFIKQPLRMGTACQAYTRLCTQIEKSFLGRHTLCT